MYRHAMRPRCRSPGQQDRDMDRHAMQNEVGYLFSELCRVKGRRGEEERKRERERNRVGGEEPQQ